MAFLVLRDDTVFKGEPFGSWPQAGLISGEAVFNTSMSGYQEMVTDLSYARQILVLTHPQIGNYGWHDEENEADKVLLRGLVVRELTRGEGSWHADRSLEGFCERRHITGLQGVDTRALTRHIREFGTLPGVFAQAPEDGWQFWQNSPDAQKESEDERSHAVYEATVRESYEIPGDGPLVAVLDCGAKRNIVRELKKRGFRLLIFPAWTAAEDILDCHPQGLVLSNGPGDPSRLINLAANVKKLYPQVPTMGICLGHQLLALAGGGTTYKLPFGHRGGNHPVQDLRTGRTTMTSQNHGYAVQAESLAKTGFRVTMRQLNDGTVEGMEHEQLPVFSVQYHPESAPGPEENNYLFDQFGANLRQV